MAATEKFSVTDDTTICYLSGEVQFLLKDLKRTVKSPEEKEKLSDVSQKVRLIQHKAQKMEKRLKKYRDSIEKLGFSRNQ